MLLLDSSDDCNTVHLYADHKTVKVFPADFQGGGHLTVNTPYRGPTRVALSVSRNRFIRALELGFTRFEFRYGDSIAPKTAKRSGGNLYLFMPLHGVNAEKIIQIAVQEAEYANIAVRPQKSETEGVAVRKESTIKKQNTHCFKGEKMQNKIDNRRPVFKVVDESISDPFDGLLNRITETRNKAREVIDMTTELSKSVKSLRVSVKAREREFKSTRDLLGKLKKVSGF